MLFASLRAGVFMSMGALVGARAPDANWGLALVAAALGSISFAGLGLVGAALTLVVRKAAAAISWLVAGLTLAAGTFFPPDLLPGWARFAAQASPFTQTLRLARGAVLDGLAWSDGIWQILLLAGMAVVFAAAGILALDLGLRWVRRRGSLSQY